MASGHLKPEQFKCTDVRTNLGSVEVKPRLASANTAQCQVRGFVGKAPARVRKYCSVLGNSERTKHFMSFSLGIFIL